jgi:hypothetical protein
MHSKIEENMKKIIGVMLCLAILLGVVSVSYADSWNARKNKVKQLLKKNNLISSDRFELVYGQKITDRMSNHFVYILQDTQTGMEYLLYTIGDGNSTIINNLAITPLLQLQPGQSPNVNKVVIPSVKDDELDISDSEDEGSEAPEEIDVIEGKM